MALEPPRIIPDQCWSWVVAAGCGWNILWLSLVRRSGGVVFVALLSEYGISREQATWVLSISFSVASLVGPVAGLLTKYFSLRALSLFGSAVLSASTIFCFLATDILALFMLLGICTGIGTGMMLVVNDTVIGQYFVRYRATGAGIYYSGGTIAAFAYPALLQMIIDYYGLKGAFLISGGLSLNSLAGSLLFRAPPRASTAKVFPVQTHVDSSAGESQNEQPLQLSASRNNSLTHGGLSWVAEDSQRGAKQRSSQVLLDKEGAVRLYDFESRSREEHVPTAVVQNENVDTAHNVSTCSEKAGPEDLTAGLLVESNINVNRGDGEAISRRSADQHASAASSAAGLWSCLAHFEFLKSSSFYLVTLGAVGFIYTVLVIMVLVDFAEEKGFSKQDGAMMLSATAIGDACARLLSGIVSDKGVLDRRTMMVINSVVAGSTCFVFPSVYSYPVMLLLCGVFGWTNGSVVVLFGPIMADYVGVQHLGVALGLSRFATGVAYFGCPKVAGHFKDNVGSYTGLFYVAGSGCLFVAMLWIGELTRVKIRHRLTRRSTHSCAEVV